MESHYFFPPASAYALNRFLFALKSNTTVRELYAAEPAATMREHGLDDDARTALREGNRDRLVSLGAHPYLVFMAQVRLSMARDPGNFEYF